MTLADQVSKLKQRFALERVVLVGDRGMITRARLREDLAPAGLDWITCLRSPRRSWSWPQTTVRSSSRCSTTATWPKSAIRAIRVSA